MRSEIFSEGLSQQGAKTDTIIFSLIEPDMANLLSYHILTVSGLKRAKENQNHNRYVFAFLYFTIQCTPELIYCFILETAPSTLYEIRNSSIP